MKVLYISIAVFLTDQISKLAVKGFSIPFLNFNWEGMHYGQSINVLGEFFRITYVENPGMAFGFEVSVIQKLFLSLFTLVAAIAIFYYLYRSKDAGLALRVGLALILGGALGNLVDRTFYGVIFGYAPLFYGKVVDFLQFEFWDFTLFGHTYETWPIFNFADTAVSVGVGVILVFHREKKPELADSDKITSDDKNNHSPQPDILENDENSNRKKISV
ncbi:Lipoprotein signal peptidase [hydrothermal vent metagenome]|uniref:Lipoprotein signal peptidase n=1 Tax=hydrothermal vent metagenome TaxID=652676 RepID=A0A3B1BWD5_9ZZZZ